MPLLAMQAECTALIRNNTWSFVPRPPNTNLVGCKWIYRIKKKVNSSLQRYQARLFVKGFNQEEGVDYFHTFSLVVKPSTVCFVISIALSKRWSIHQLDINNAFLSDDLHETIYMEQPKGFLYPAFPLYVCKLNKYIYRLRQTPRDWFDKFKSFLLFNGFRSCYHDTSLFVYHHPK